MRAGFRVHWFTIVSLVSIAILASGCSTTTEKATESGSTAQSQSATGGGPVSESGLTSEDTDQADLTPLSIGVLAPISGPLSNIGEALVNGAGIAAELLSGPASGFEIHLEVADTKYDPTVAVQQFRQIASDGKISFINGLPSSASCKAVSDIATALETVYIGDCIDGSLLEQPSPYFVMGAAGAADLAKGAAGRAHDKYPDVLEWDSYALDYVTGHGVIKNFQDRMTDFGGTLSKSVWAPLDATDVRPFLTSLQQATPLGSNKGLVVYAFGDLGASFLKQASSVELPDRYKVIVWVNADDLALQGVGASLPQIEAVTDVMTEAYLKSDKTVLTEFVKRYEEKFGKFPPDEATKTLKEMQVGVSAAMQAASTKGSDIQKVLVGLKAQTIKGDSVINEHQYLEQSVVAGTCRGDSTDPKGRNFVCEDISVIPPQ